MTSVSSEAGALVAELIQSRDANASEALAIMRTQGAAFRRRLAAVRGYRAARIAWTVLFLGLLAGFFFATKMHWIPRISSWIALPLMFMVAFGLCRLWSRYASRVCAKIYQEALRGECRLRLEAEGIVVSGAGTVSLISWSAIRDIVANKDCITIYLSAIHTMSFPVGTFEGQDVESFAAELVRRWQAHRAPTGAPA
jgi:hypothetical protein